MAKEYIGETAIARLIDLMKQEFEKYLKTEEAKKLLAPQLPAIGDEDAEQVLGKDFRYNRLYCERSWLDQNEDGVPDYRGPYARVCLTEQPKPPPNPTTYVEDPTSYDNGEYGEGVTLNSVPQRTKHGDLRVPKRTFDEAKALDEHNYLDYAASLYILKKELENKLGLMPDHSLISMPYVYVENADRTVTGYPLAHGPISSSARVVQSLSDGSIRCKVPANAQNDYVVNKGYVDTAIEALVTKLAEMESKL